MFDRILTRITVAVCALAVLTAVGLPIYATVLWSQDDSAPRCTDAIADAGGICHGEPLPPCPTEDSDDCYWDGGANGLGRSFVVESGVVTFTD